MKHVSGVRGSPLQELLSRETAQLGASDPELGDVDLVEAELLGRPL